MTSVPGISGEVDLTRLRVLMTSLWNGGLILSGSVPSTQLLSFLANPCDTALMSYLHVFRSQNRAVFAALALLFATGQAHGTDMYAAANRQLTMPSLQIGSATLTNVVVTIGNIVSGPSGSTPIGSEDSYEPGTNQLTVQSVAVGAATYYNVVATVSALISIGGVTGADTFNGTNLNIPLVQDGSTVYKNVIVGEVLSGVVSVGGGMPTAAPDTYNSITNQLAIAAVQAGNHVYTNVVVAAGKLLGVGGELFTNQESILHEFSNGDGANPTYLIQGRDGNLYGTTSYGGAHGGGTLFEVTPAGVTTVIYDFYNGPTDGAEPVSLFHGTDGNFYGATAYGGTSSGPGFGIIFKITPSGVETILHSFQGAPADGGEPSVLIPGSDGNFYGATAVGGAYGYGTVFRIAPDGTETLLHSFRNDATDGTLPLALVQGSDGNFYGTTYGNFGNSLSAVFRISPDGAETILHVFMGGAMDGSYPSGTVALIQGSDGNFYGVTAAGGARNGGTLFRISPSGEETLVYSFGAATDGSAPAGLIQGRDGNFYGVCNSGGANAFGTVFEVTPTGVETTLYSFPATGTPYYPGPLIQARDGNIYGTTEFGGISAPGGGVSYGMVLKMTNLTASP